MRRRWRRSIPASAGAALALLALALSGCTEGYTPFDSAGYLRDVYSERLEPELAQEVELEVPFELSESLKEVVNASIKPSQDIERGIDQVQSFIFEKVGLQYSLSPTRNAVGTFNAREGNCMSFTNLFIGVARQVRLNPFYVEVTDYNRWAYRDGLVVSQGHIVVGMRIDGKLQTYDFLPYRPKSYKEFNPIDDSTAAAHYYNNLAAEALIAGDEKAALSYVEVATRIAPDFTKALNNLGVTLARMGRLDEALAVYADGLEVDPQNVAILSNLVRAYQQLGRAADADEILACLEGLRHTNPFFFIYQGELALSQDDPQRALNYMKEAFRRDSEIPEVHMGLAKAYLALGDLEKAQHHVGRCLRLDATYQECRKLAELLR